jgi:hypothetical protein
MTDAERRLVENAYKVTVDQDGYEHYERLPGVSGRARAKADRVIDKRDRLLSRMVAPTPDPGAFRVYHLLVVKKMSLLEIAAKGSPVERYLTRPRNEDKKTSRKKQPTPAKVQREERQAASRKTIAIRERDAVKHFKAVAPEWVFELRSKAAVDNWPHR